MGVEPEHVMESMDPNALQSKRVFISYTHDSAAHEEEVLGLTYWLRQNGIDAEIDAFQLSPPEGWSRWMINQIDDADFVLVVCSPLYCERFSGRRGPGGKGAKWEGCFITHEIYEGEAHNEKFIPVVFSDDDLDHIPSVMKPWMYYVVSEPKGLERLYRRITGQPEHLRGPLGSVKKLPPAEHRGFFDAVLRQSARNEPCEATVLEHLDSGRVPDALDNSHLEDDALTGQDGDALQLSGRYMEGEGGSIQTATDELEIELKLNRPFESFGPEQQKQWKDGIQNLLDLGEVTIKRVRRGSVVLTLRGSAEDIERIHWSARQGELNRLGVAEVSEPEEAGGSERRSRRHSEFPREEEQPYLPWKWTPSDRERLLIDRLLANRTCSAIVQQLVRDSQLSVSDLSGCVDAHPSTIRRHLEELRVAGFVEARRQGRSNLFSLSGDRVLRLLGRYFAEHARIRCGSE